MGKWVGGWDAQQLGPCACTEQQNLLPASLPPSWPEDGQRRGLHDCCATSTSTSSTVQHPAPLPLPGTHTRPAAPAGEARAAAFRRRQADIAATEELLDSVILSSSSWGRHGLPVSQDGTWVSAAQMLTRPGASLAQIAAAAAAEGAAGAARLAALAQRSGGISLGQAEWGRAPGGGVAGSSGAGQPAPALGVADATDEQPSDGQLNAGQGASSSSSSSSPAAAGDASGGQLEGWREPGASAVATAAYNCHYRPYMRKQVGGGAAGGGGGWGDWGEGG